LIVDAHQHFWNPARGDYGWLTPDSPLFRTFGPIDLEPLFRGSGVDATVVVQAAPTDAETDHLLDLAQDNNWIAGVVGWINLEAEDSPEAIERRAACQSFVGVRPMLQDMANRSWILRRELRAALTALEEVGLVFDALVRCDQLEVVERLAERHPSLTIMVDHAAKPPFGRKHEMSTWLEDLARVAARPNTYCKLSGLLTELPPGSGLDEVTQAITQLLSAFGADRLVWGSDWPVLTLAGEYGQWFDLCRSELERHGAATVDAVMGGNARQIYKLTA
jgi:L-fuconolactonase